MLYGIVLIKGLVGEMEYTHDFLRDMMEKKILEEKNVEMREVLLSMGWPDIVILLRAEKTEYIQEAISYIKKMLKEREEHADLIETSTIICITEEEKRIMR